jgi:hypothetical protein
MSCMQVFQNLIPFNRLRPQHSAFEKRGVGDSPAVIFSQKHGVIQSIREKMLGTVVRFAMHL